ncbi:hypothetical protein JCM10295v2_003013 [Rhodotorula toruloides]
MSRSSELLTNAAFTTKAFPLLQPVYVGIDAALTSEAQQNARDKHRYLQRKFPYWSFRESLTAVHHSFELVWTADLLLARFSVWGLQRFASGRVSSRPVLAQCISALDLRPPREAFFAYPLETRDAALPEERVVDEVILGICAARDHYNKPEKGYMERLEAYIVQLTARAAPAMPFETVEAVSHSVQRLFQLFEVVVTQASEHRLQQRVFLLIYLLNLLVEPSESILVTLPYKLETIERYVKVELSVASSLTRSFDDEVFPTRTILRYIQRLLYIEVSRFRSPRRPASVPCSALQPDAAARSLLEVLETLVSDPTFDKVDLTSLCRLFYDACAAHKRLARLGGELA